MADIATLGLAIDSTQATAASAALDKLTTSAAPAAAALAAVEQAATKWGAASVVASKAANTVATSTASIKSAAAPATAAYAAVQKSLQSAVGDLNVYAAAQRNGTNVVDAGSESLRGQRMVLRGLVGDLALLGPQFGQTAGMAALLYIDNAHLVGGFSGLRSAISGLLTPTNLLIGSFVAIAAGSLIAYNAIKAQELAMGELSERTESTVQSLHGLESVAAFKGIDTADFLKGMTQFSDLTAQAKDNMGSLADLFRANNVQAGSFTQNLYKAADLIANARTEAQKYQLLQQMGLPVTREWVQYLSQGSVGIQDAARAAAQFGGAADEQLIKRAREFDEAWNTGWKNFTTGAKAAFVEITSWKMPPWMAKIISMSIDPASQRKANSNTLAGQFDNANSDLGKFTNSGLQNGLNSKAASIRGGGTVDPNVLKNQISLQQQYIGLLGPLANLQQQAAQKENELTLARLAGVSVTTKDADAIKAYAAATALGLIAIRQSTDAENINAGAVGLGTGAVAAYRAEQTKLADFRLRGISLTDQQSAALHNEAQALGEAAQAAANLQAKSNLTFNTSQLGRDDTEQQVATQMRQLYGDAYTQHMNDAIAGQIRMNDALTTTKSISGGALTGFLQDIRSGTQLLPALANQLAKVADQLISIASNRAISSLFGGTTGGGGLLGLLGLGGGTASVSSAGSGVGGAASLVAHTGAIVGSEFPATRYIHPAYFDDAPRFHTGGIVDGEVPIIAKRGEGVFTPGQMKALAPVGQSAPSVTNHNYYDFTNADPGSEARMRAYVDASNERTRQQTVQDVAKLHRNSPGTYLPRSG
jgi:hypothetical protein